MKKFSLISGFLLLVSALGLRAYFAFVPPPEPTLHTPLSEVFPAQLDGWKVTDKDMADSPEMSAWVTDFLNFDDALFRIYQKGNTTIGLYVAYWKPGTASYRWAGAHTPDTCWVLNGWTCDAREYSVPFNNEAQQFQPAEFGIYSKDGNAQKVHFWHLVGGEAMAYKQAGIPNVLGALIDIKEHGLDLRKEQFFIRMSSNQDLASLKSNPEFKEILDAMAAIGMITDN